MTFVGPTFLLSWRAIRQLPRLPVVLVFSLFPPLIQLVLFGSLFGNLTKTPGFPVSNYYTYLAPAVVLFTAVIGIANASVALVADFENRYFQKLLVSPASMWSILLGRLLSDGIRIYLTAGIVLLISFAFGARVKTGLGGALLLLALTTVFAILTVGTFGVNVALKTKSQQSVQAAFPIFFILMFLTSAFNAKSGMPTTLQRVVEWNPAQYIVEALQDLMFLGFDLGRFLTALGVTFGLGLVGVLVTWRNYRNVYA